MNNNLRCHYFNNEVVDFRMGVNLCNIQIFYLAITEESSIGQGPQTLRSKLSFEYKLRMNWESERLT